VLCVSMCTGGQDAARESAVAGKVPPGDHHLGGRACASPPRVSLSPSPLVRHVCADSFNTFMPGRLRCRTAVVRRARRLSFREQWPWELKRVWRQLGHTHIPGREVDCSSSQSSHAHGCLTSSVLGVCACTSVVPAPTAYTRRWGVCLSQRGRHVCGAGEGGGAHGEDVCVQL
jgi:hypothetical protein